MAAKKATRPTITVYVDAFTEFELSEKLADFLADNAGKDVGTTKVLSGVSESGKVQHFAPITFIGKNGLPVVENRRIWSDTNLLAPMRLKVSKGSSDEERDAIQAVMSELNAAWRETLSGTVIAS
jgi:hypothetical protein